MLTTEEIRDQLLKDDLTRLANSVPQNCQESLRQAFELSAKGHISKYIKNKRKQREYLSFYNQQIENQTGPFNPRYLENLAKI